MPAIDIARDIVGLCMPVQLMDYEMGSEGGLDAVTSMSDVLVPERTSRLT